MLDRLTGNGSRLQQGPRGIGHSINSPVQMIAARIAQVMLPVADNRFLPIQKINRAVGRNVHARGTKIRIVRLHERRLQGFARKTGILLLDLDPVNALETDDIDVEKISLKFIGKMAAGQNARARTGTRGTLPELFHARVFAGKIDVTAESVAEIGVVGRG